MRCIGLKRHLFCYQHCTPITLPKWPYFNYPTYNGPIYKNKGQAMYFSSQSLLGLPRLLNKSITNQFRTALARRQMSLSLISIIKLITRMAVVYKATVFAMHKTTLLTVRIKPTKAVISLLVNIKPT